MNSALHLVTQAPGVKVISFNFWKKKIPKVSDDASIRERLGNVISGTANDYRWNFVKANGTGDIIYHGSFYYFGKRVRDAKERNKLADEVEKDNKIGAVLRISNDSIKLALLRADEDSPIEYSFISQKISSADIGDARKIMVDAIEKFKVFGFNAKVK